MQHESLGRYFHDNSLYAAVRHIAKQLLQDDRFRRRVRGRNPHLTLRCLIEGLYRPHEACADACGLQNRAHHICGGRFSLCPGYSDHLHPLCGMTVKSSGNSCHRISGILNTNNCRHFICRIRCGQPLAGKTGVLLNDQCSRTLFQSSGSIVMSVAVGSLDAEKKAARHNFPRIICDLCNLLIQKRLYGCLICHTAAVPRLKIIRYFIEQFSDLHSR